MLTDVVRVGLFCEIDDLVPAVLREMAPRRRELRSERLSSGTENFMTLFSDTPTHRLDH